MSFNNTLIVIKIVLDKAMLILTQTLNLVLRLSKGTPNVFDSKYEQNDIFMGKYVDRD